MFLIYKVILNIHLKDMQFYFISRLFRSSRLIFDESKFLHDTKPKRKINIIKKKIDANKQISIVDSKLASDIIKRLNWENKHLYGPVLSSNFKSPNLSNVLEPCEIIQHETQIPIIEPSVDSNNGKPNTQICNNEQINDLSSILSFPLLNKFVHSSYKVNELNHLRKHLEFLSKDSAIPSVSLILQSTMPKERMEVLDKWKQGMISQLGKEGFERYQKELFANGVSLHHSISSFLVAAPEFELQIKEENFGHWKSLKHVLPNIKDVKLIEEFVVHPFLSYRGVVDCFAKYKDHLVVIDWKTSKKSKAKIENTYDDPLQIAAYVGALNFDPKYQYLASKGLIVVAYENGMPATAHFLNDSTMKYYWNEWLKRVKQFWEMRSSEIKDS